MDDNVGSRSVGVIVCHIKILIHSILPFVHRRRVTVNYQKFPVANAFSIYWNRNESRLIYHQFGSFSQQRFECVAAMMPLLKPKITKSFMGWKNINDSILAFGRFISLADAAVIVVLLLSSAGQFSILLSNDVLWQTMIQKQTTRISALLWCHTKLVWYFHNGKFD